MATLRTRPGQPTPFFVQAAKRTALHGPTQDTHRLRLVCPLRSLAGSPCVDALLTETKTDDEAGTLPAVLKTEPVLVLFKHDLRVEDHPGLDSVVRSGKQFIPVYCLDVDLIRPLATVPGGIALLVGSLRMLKTRLRDMGSDLIFRIGRLSETVLDVANETGSNRLVTEMEVDSRWRAEIDRIRGEASSLLIEEWTSASSATNGDRTIERIVDQEFGNGSKNGYKNGATVNGFPQDLVAGSIPTVENLRIQLKERLETDSHGFVDMFGREHDEIWDRWSNALTSHPGACLECIKRYLNPSVSVANEDDVDVLTEVRDRMEEPSFPGVSFAPLFSTAFSLGLITPKQVRQEVKAAQGWVPWRRPFLHAAWRNSVSYERCTELHTDILINGCSGTPGTSDQKLWKWQGMTAEYSVLHPKQPSEGAVVLVHGFGATCMHWRRNVDALSDAGYTIYCPSLPGYGRTQTLYMKYTQAVWRNFLTGFLTEIVRRPAVLAGNSIGAFVATAVAAERPEMVDGLVLLNPAGPVDAEFVPGSQGEAVLKQPPSAFMVNVFSRLTLTYLSITAGRLLRKVYPVNKQNADEAFLDEILDASKDPNADAVIKSSFFLKKPTPLNYLLKEMYRRPTLLLQGALDPLNDAEGRARLIGELCPNVEVDILNAGHCPHDEAPEIVNPKFLKFLEGVKKRAEASREADDASVDSVPRMAMLGTDE